MTQGQEATTPKQSDPAPLFLTVEQAAKVLNVSKDTVYRFIHVQGFPCVWFGRAVRIIAPALEDWGKANIGKVIDI